jgi:membrane-associated protein
MVELIDGPLEALAGLPLWALAGAVAVVMALEASLLTGVIVPGDLVVLFAASTATTPTQFAVLWAAVAAGSVVGETVGYAIGRVFGERVQASRIGRWLGEERWARAADFLQRCGARAVFAGAVPGGGPCFPADHCRYRPGRASFGCPAAGWTQASRSP